MSDYPSFDDTEAIIQDLYRRGVLSRDTPEGQRDTRDTKDRGDRGDSHLRPRTSWTAAELMATDFPEPRWAVPGLVTEGVNLLAGPPKVGKSWLTLGVSLAVASPDGIALGAVKVEQGPVLYLALEDTPRRLKDRLGRMLAGAPAPSALTLVTVCPPLPDGGDKLIANWLKRNPDARLVVLDVFARMRGATPPGASAYDADYNAVVRAKVLADHFGVAFVLVHHVRKAGAADFLETVSGTNGLAGAADTILVLKRTRGAADAELHVTGRDVDERKLALKFSADLGLWQQLEGDPVEHTVSDTRAVILRHLREQGPATPKRLADALDLDHELAKKTVRRMVDDGQLDTDGRGTYLLPVPAVPLSPPAGQSSDSEGQSEQGALALHDTPTEGHTQATLRPHDPRGRRVQAQHYEGGKWIDSEIHYDLRGMPKGDALEWTGERLVYPRHASKRRVRQKVTISYCAEGWHSTGGSPANPTGPELCHTLFDPQWANPGGGLDRDRFHAFHDQHPVVWVVRIFQGSNVSRLPYCDPELPDEYRELWP